MAVEEEDDVVIRMINSASALRSETLDLSKKRIYEIPKEILNLKHLESLHLEGNYLTELPEEFFENLTSLKWLDLRNNRLCKLPVNVGQHRSLRSLLLEHNSLTHLPCELGMARSLCGLHLSGNPMEFPPPYIVEKGTQEILKYLRDMCEKSDECLEEKCGESMILSDEESEDMVPSPGFDYGESPNPVQSAGSERLVMEDHTRRMSAFKLPPIVRNATTVRRSNTDVSDKRDVVQGHPVTKFEPIRRSMPPLDVAMETSVRKRRNKGKEQDGGFLDSRNEDFTEVVMEEAPSRDEEIPETFQKIKIKKKKKKSPKKAKNVVHPDEPSNNLPALIQEDVGNGIMGDEIQARFNVSVGDMVAIRVAEKHYIKGQPCVGKVVAEVDARGLVLVHYYVGSYDGTFRPMMSRSSPYLRKVSLENIICKFVMQSDGRLSPKTAIRIRQMVDR